MLLKSFSLLPFITMALASTYPTRLLAGICVPDTPTITKAIALARANSDDQLYNHVMRSWLVGTASLSHLPANVTHDIDLEAFAVAAILHDLGLNLNNTDIASKDKRFEVDGANAAVEFLKKEGGKGWTEEKLWEVWYAIALHTVNDIAVHSAPLVWSLCVGVGTEIFSPEFAVMSFGPDKVAVTMQEWEQINRAFPRTGFKDSIINKQIELCRAKPRSTYGTYQADFGEMFLKEEGYSEVGFRNIDMILGMKE
ncbi:hypothetical protein BDW02DRAFT_493457 [Decorospora gaudefroyi]|uniref:HD domain-containing protein n=1 Tax=Decorospora gaudefroyi TaxID=184978 RepID=A0A6A5KKC0_9PLEO|nr:hypothetical protein BDW02DRAFT_493457 [Decorospora gaudefroyi]